MDQEVKNSRHYGESPQSIMNNPLSSSGGYHSRAAAIASLQPRGGGGRRGGHGGGSWQGGRGGGDGGVRIYGLGSSFYYSSGGYHSTAAIASPQPRGGGGGRGVRGNSGGWGGHDNRNRSDHIDALGSSSSSSSSGYHSMAADFPPLQPRGGGTGRGGGDGNGNHRIDTLGSSSSSSGDYHSMATAFASLKLHDGGGSGQGGHSGGHGSERFDAPCSSSSSLPSSRGYHSRASSFASPQLRGDGGRGRGYGGRGGRDGGDGRRIAALGRIMSRVLRHMAAGLGLKMRTDGYVRVSDLLKLNLWTYAEVPLKSHTVDEIREAVRRDSKLRFSLLEEDGELLIRANQGHTVTTVTSESLLKPILSADEVSVCVHGTFRSRLGSILQSGLNRMERLHVHFSSGLPSDGEVISGMRKNVNILIHLDVRKALHDGMKLYISGNNVILTEGFDGVVPVKYFEKIETWPGRAPKPFQR
ncbi:unnamed protein product [Urochloa decumbens]|uniref:2'-phosphotransferase n=1 Tax=Urochloa decumbens TaxID=240449 RepID=A0ABC9FUX5_9POAL